MNLRQLLASTMLLATLGNSLVLATEFSEVDLDSTVFQSPTTEFTEVDLDSQEFQNPDMGVGDELPDMGVGGDLPDMGVDTEENTQVSPEVEEFDLPDFTDVDTHWGKDHIERAVRAGLFRGKTETTFEPDTNITRAEFIIVMLSIRGVEVEAAKEGEAWYTPYYEAAVMFGNLAETITLENFTEFATREEMASMAIKTLGTGSFTTPEGNSENIADYDSIQEIFRNDVTLAYENKLMSGKGEGFDPSNNALRAEAAVVALNVMDYYIEANKPPEYVKPEVNPLSEEYCALLDSVRDEDSVLNVPAMTATTHTDSMLWMMVRETLPIQEEDMEAFAIASPIMNVAAHTVFIAKAAEGKMESLEASVAEYHEHRINTSYPSTEEVIRNAVIKTIADEILIFVMDENAEQIAEDLLAALTLG